jgi:hypothetical protein
MIDNFDNHISRLRNEGNRLNNNSHSIGESCLVVSYLIKSNYDPEQVIGKIKEVLQILNSTCMNRNIFPTDEEWRLLLPSWFVEKCKPERTQQQILEDSNRWDNLSYEQRIQYIESPTRSWELSAWIQYFHPDDRQWYWCNYSIVDTNCFILSIEVEDLPFSSGSFYWLLQASGANSIEEIID